MKEIRARFERDEALEHIDVLVRAPERDAEVNALFERMTGAPPDTLTAAGPEGALCKLAVDDIVMVSVNGKHTRLVTEDESYTVRQALQSIESALPVQKFVRVSRYELVNIEKVRKYDFTLAGTLRLELSGGMETRASRRCIPAIRARLNGKEAQRE